MLLTWTDAFTQRLQRWQALPRDLLILRLTAVLILLHGLDEFTLTRLPEKLISLLLIAFPSLLRQPALWWLLTACLTANTIHLWYQLVNHEYLLTYWCGVCAIAVQSRRSLSTLRWHGRLFIGLCFLFATLWKIVGGEYLNGGFLHLTFLLDSRLAMGAILLGGVDWHDLALNQGLFTQLNSGLTNETTLITTPTLVVVSLILSVWTIFIEGTVAIAFLCPRLAWFYRHRDWWLILFIVTTYAVIPVISFAALLLILGIAQQPLSPTPQLTTYLALLVLMPLWMFLPQVLFYVWQTAIGVG